MRYEPDSPDFGSMEGAKEYLRRELDRIAEALNQAGYPTLINFQIRYGDTDRPREGMVAYADGSTWNPLNGPAGLHLYIGDAWRPIGTRNMAVTPRWEASTTDPTLGNGTLAGRYHRFVDMIDFRIHLTYGSTSAPGTGAWSFRPPANLDTGSSEDTVGTAVVLDGTTSLNNAYCTVDSGDSVMRVFAEFSGAPIQLQPAIPITWATDDQVIAAARWFADA